MPPCTVVHHTTNELKIINVPAADFHIDHLSSVGDMLITQQWQQNLPFVHLMTLILKSVVFCW